VQWKSIEQSKVDRKVRFLLQIASTFAEWQQSVCPRALNDTARISPSKLSRFPPMRAACRLETGREIVEGFFFQRQFREAATWGREPSNIPRVAKRVCFLEFGEG